LAVWVDQEEQKLGFLIFNTAQRYSFTIPIQNETVNGKNDDILMNYPNGIIKAKDNPNEYHQDWPFELRETKI